MIRRRNFVGLLGISLLALPACQRREPIVNVTDIAYGNWGATRRPLTLDDYEKAIVRAGSERGWIFNRVGPGHLVGTVEVRGRHEATVDVLFNEEDFSITYKSSQNLNYDAAANTIHPNYNSWVQLLENDIRTEIQELRAG